MNNQFKWVIQDIVKKYLLEMVKSGKTKDEIRIFNNIDFTSKNPIMETANEAIKFLINSKYIKQISETEYVIDEEYYDWILEKLNYIPSGCKSPNFYISTKLKQRFCKDMGIPIKIYHEPYFESRLKLYDYYFDSIDKYKSFLELLSNFKSEQDYFEYYNNLKDSIINYLGSRKGMEKFKEEDMNKFKIKNQGFPEKDIYKEIFDNEIFFSIDMVRANFTSLRHYDKSIVGGNIIYEEFIEMFTEYDYFKNSKYIRQVVFGNHNPKRQVTYEKYLMDKLLTELLKVVPKEDVVFFSNDEIVIHLDKSKFKDYEYIRKIKYIIWEYEHKEGLVLRQEIFRLRKIPGTKGYVKKFIGCYNKKPEFKCLDALTMPFVLRAYQNEEVQEEDKVFFYEGKLAKLIEVPNIKVI